MSAPRLQATAVRLFREWINQKPRLDPFNYGSASSLRSEYARIRTQKKRATEALLRFTEQEYDAAVLDQIMQTVYSGRLRFNEHGDSLTYVAGQYAPTERKVAAQVVLEAYNDLMARCAVPSR